jgi:hypothetical protein
MAVCAPPQPVTCLIPPGSAACQAEPACFDDLGNGPFILFLFDLCRNRLKSFSFTHSLRESGS